MTVDDFDPFARWREPTPVATPERTPGGVANTERLPSRPAVLVVRDMLTTSVSSLREAHAHADTLGWLIEDRRCAMAAERASQLRHAMQYAQSKMELAYFHAESDAPHLVDNILHLSRRLLAEVEWLHEILTGAPTPAEEADPAAWVARLDAEELEWNDVPMDDEPMGQLIDATELFRRAGTTNRNGER